MIQFNDESFHIRALEREIYRLKREIEFFKSHSRCVYALHSVNQPPEIIANPRDAMHIRELRLAISCSAKRNDDHSLHVITKDYIPGSELQFNYWAESVLSKTDIREGLLSMYERMMRELSKDLL